MNDSPKRSQILIALLAVYLIWGSTYFAIKLALPDYPPFFITAIRLAIAGLIMLAYIQYKHYPLPTAKQWKPLVILAAVMTVFASALINVAEQTVSSGVVAIGVAAMPLWAGFFAALRGYHPSKIEWSGLLLGFFGVVWLNIGSELRVSTIGLLCVLSAPMAWAWGSMWSKDQDLPDPIVSSAWQMFIGSVIAMAIGLSLGERITHLPSTQSTLALLYLTVFGSIVAYSAFVWLVKHVRPALATSYAYVNPPIALLLGVTLLDEPLNSHTVVAMILILMSIGIVTLGKRLHQSSTSS
ncbi:MAG: drug/metabolite exporter YedA [Arenimonas sp.]|nr:drug/metabolite exporter YedA [Arenimonas sp.]